MGQLWRALSMNQRDRLVFVLHSMAEEYEKLAPDEQQFFLLTLVGEFEKVGVSLEMKKE